MARQTFDWIVDVGTSGSFDERMLTAQFGDGYIQEVGDGLNTERQSWPITVFGTGTHIRPILDFLREHKGRVPFDWVTPLGEQVIVVGKEVKVSSEGADTFTLTATFEQRFVP